MAAQRARKMQSAVRTGKPQGTWRFLPTRNAILSRRGGHAAGLYVLSAAGLGLLSMALLVALAGAQPAPPGRLTGPSRVGTRTTQPAIPGDDISPRERLLAA